MAGLGRMTGQCSWGEPPRATAGPEGGRGRRREAGSPGTGLLGGEEGVGAQGDLQMVETRLTAAMQEHPVQGGKPGQAWVLGKGWVGRGPTAVKGSFAGEQRSGREEGR